MDAALLFVALVAAGALILALVRARGSSTTSVGFASAPPQITVHEESKTFSLDELPPELQAEGNELAQLALKGKAGGAGLTQADKERLLELARDLAERAPGGSSNAVPASGDDAIKLMHVETRTNFDVR